MIRPVSRSTYVPHIDGLRALAVLSVIVYHLNERWVPGGFSGVDIFFVISGFVVSASLAEYRKSTSFAFFAYFYARRILRIVPALVICLLLTHVAAMLFIPSAWLSLANERTGIWAFFGLSNFILAQTGNDYFSPTADFNPYTHTWSLGVEEQFYLIFPPLFLAWIAGGRWRRLSVLLFGVGLVASIACAWWWGTVDRYLAFYMLFSRFWELAAGVLLYQWLSLSGHAFSETGRPATRWSQVGALVSVALIVVGFLIARPLSFPFPGGLLPVLGTVGLLASLHGRESRGPIMRALRIPIVVFIGQTSYSLYLWHWPVFVLFRWTVGLESVTARIAAVAITFVLAIASYLFVERPPRRSPVLRAAPRPAVIALGVGLVAASVLIATQVTRRAPQLSLNTVARNMPEWYPGQLTGNEHADCRLTTRVQDIGGGTRAVWSGSDCSRTHAPMPRLFVIGDSHAGAYTTMLQLFAMNTGADVYMYTNGGCPFLSLQPEREGAACPRHAAVAVADVLRNAKKGDILFLPSLRLNRLSNQYAPADLSTTWSKMLRAGGTPVRDVRAAIDVLKPFASLGMRIVFDAPKPIFRSPPFRCADWFNADNPICAPGMTMSRTELERYRRSVLDAFAQISRQVPGVSVWDTFPLLCPGDECRTSLDGHPLFFDGDHLSGYANRLLLPEFENYVTNLAGTAPLETKLPRARRPGSKRVDVAQRANQSSCALVGLGGGLGVTAPFETPLLAQRLARGAALVGLLVQGLRDAGRPALAAQLDDVNDEGFLRSPDAQTIADVQGFRRLARQIVELDLAAFDRELGQRARLEESGGPEPDVQAHRRRGRRRVDPTRCVAVCRLRHGDGSAGLPDIRADDGSFESMRPAPFADDRSKDP